MRINDPAVLAELTGRHKVYEKALLSNDVETLEALFWDSPHAVRYGVTENLHGADEIRTFRKGRPAINLNRRISRLEIVTLGGNLGIVNLEFVRAMDGVEKHGRQTQFWFRLAEGWRILSAHVSLLPVPSSPLDGIAARVGIPIQTVNREAVLEDFNRIGAIAGYLMEFPLSQNVEAAPVFHP